MIKKENRRLRENEGIRIIFTTISEFLLILGAIWIGTSGVSISSIPLNMQVLNGLTAIFGSVIFKIATKYISNNPISKN